MDHLNSPEQRPLQLPRPLRPAVARSSALRTLPSAFLFAACMALPARGDSFDNAAMLVPPNATSVLLVPNPKAASDDLQLAIDRMGRAETGMGGRPIDLLRARLGIGAGFDDRGPVAVWTEPQDGALVFVAALPVTDAGAFMQAFLVPAPAAGADAYTMKGVPQPVFARALGKHVLLAQDARSARAYDPKEGIGATLAAHLGARGMAIARAGDACAWAGGAVFMQSAAALRAVSPEAAADAGVPLGGDGPMTREQLIKARDRSAELLAQVTDGLIALDFDALAVGVRSFARFSAEGEIARAIPAAGATPRKPAAALGMLPAAPFYGAMGIDVAGMGGMAHVRSFLATIPGSQRVPLPEWLDAVQDKVTALQVAAYPSKLSILAGGVLNDSSFVVVTTDPPAVKAALQKWILAQAGESDGIRREPVWEAVRELKNGVSTSAFAVKEVVTGPGGDAMTRLTRQVVVGTRGLHGFAKEVPGALVVTFSQRMDVQERAVAAATGGEAKTLGTNSVVRAMAPWLVPDPDIVAFIGVAELMNAARQVASAMPGGGEAMIPPAPATMEPIATALRAKDGTWEAALVVPSSVLAVGFDAIKAEWQRGMQPPAAAPAASPAPAPAPAPAAAPAASPASAPAQQSPAAP